VQTVFRRPKAQALKRRRLEGIAVGEFQRLGNRRGGGGAGRVRQAHRGRDAQVEAPADFPPFVQALEDARAEGVAGPSARRFRGRGDCPNFEPDFNAIVPFILPFLSQPPEGHLVASARLALDTL